MRAPRTYLFVPADRPERIAKALASGADAVIVDLEDAVAPTAKDQARDTLRDWLARTDARIVLRLNGVDTPWHEADRALCRAPGIAAVMCPKAERAGDLDFDGKPVLPLVETAAGFDALREIARAPGVERLVFGSIDFQLDLGIAGDGDELLPFRSHIVLASRLAGIAPPVDGVSTAIDDGAQLHADALRARRLGFGAKLCIHPRQVEAVNRAFTPSDDEVEWARRVLAAAQAAGGRAVAVDGKMVDRPVILRAEALLRQAGGS
ncbi:CoA ester lyase [Piscinibacter sp. XHJ-5]|uniref:HpcH/HpaI aldolase/citrate lyase family protein n=1 Tax=Piscinibacter sp. XHJ-5 TaxID=3037797 RepID=UPI0024528214|nr:CoA ester lyase [Piscinibacter sp. XHJ-5]